MTDDIAKVEKLAKTPRVSKRLAEAVRLLLTGEVKTQKAAAERVGMNETYLSEALRKPHIRVFVDRRVRESIAKGTMRASARLLELVDAGSEHVSLDASKHLLAIEGIKPAAEPTTQVNINVRAGYVIDLSEPGDAAIDVTPTNRRPSDT
jgi:hypothetical protein